MKKWTKILAITAIIGFSIVLFISTQGASAAACSALTPYSWCF